MVRQSPTSFEYRQQEIIDSNIIAIVQKMFGDEAERVVSNLNQMEGPTQKLAIKSIERWNGVMSANESMFLKVAQS